ncbi:MAG: META domain-containing protein [Prevotellaceae bacterium]|jgi:heat shock protein HslJ|nr:META domain-containing protein [Prevotellaceae bacterium]
MKKFVIIMAVSAIILGLNACKSKQKVAETSKPAAEITDESKKLVGKTWQLVELNGNSVENEAFIVFGKDNRFNGNLGCNLMNGTYELNGSRIQFGQVISTKKLCLNMTVEDEFAKVLQVADSFYVSESELILNRARMAPLAKFVAKK